MKHIEILVLCFFALSVRVSAQWRDDFSTDLRLWQGDTALFACTERGLESRGRAEASDIGLRRAFYRDSLPQDSAFCVEFALDLGFVPSSTNTLRLYLADCLGAPAASDSATAGGDSAYALYLHLGEKGSANYWQLWEKTPDTLRQLWQGKTLFSKQSQMKMRVRAVFDTGGVWRLFYAMGVPNAQGVSNAARWEQDGEALRGEEMGQGWTDRFLPCRVGMQCAYKTVSRATMYGFPYVYTGRVPVEIPQEEEDEGLSMTDSLAALIPSFGSVVMNEVMFNPATGESRYVEFYNRTDTAFGIKNWALGIRQEEGWKYYKITDDTAVLEAGAYAAWAKEARKVALSATACRENIFTAKTFPTLDNKEGELRLVWLPPKDDSLHADTVLIDEILYSERAHHWLLSDPKGVALERLRAEVSGLDIENWVSAAETVGFATPGCENSHSYPALQPSQDEYFIFTPPLVTPNNDGQNDFTVLTWSHRLDGFVCSVAVYDEKGRKVRQLCNKMLLGAGGSLRYDAVDESGRVLRAGIYAVLVELLRPDGKIKRLRYVLAVG